MLRTSWFVVWKCLRVLATLQPVRTFLILIDVDVFWLLCCFHDFHRIFFSLVFLIFNRDFNPYNSYVCITSNSRLRFVESPRRFSDASIYCVYFSVICMDTVRFVLVYSSVFYFIFFLFRSMCIGLHLHSVVCLSPVFKSEISLKPDRQISYCINGEHWIVDIVIFWNLMTEKSPFSFFFLSSSFLHSSGFCKENFMHVIIKYTMQ